MKKGISLISLIITIIVIIILAAIVIFNGLNAPNSANFAKFTQQVDNVQMAVTNKYGKLLEKHSLADETRTQEQVYLEIATGADQGISKYMCTVGTSYADSREESTGVQNITVDGAKNTDHSIGMTLPMVRESNTAWYVTKDGIVFNANGYEYDGKTYFTGAMYQPGTLASNNTSNANRAEAIYAEMQNGKNQIAEVPETGSENITYTVTFDSQGGTEVASITNVVKGTTITAPTAPTKSGKEFGGWYKEAGLTNAFDFTTDTIKKNTTLYAKWNTPIEIGTEVTFDGEQFFVVGKDTTNGTVDILTKYCLNSTGTAQLDKTATTSTYGVAFCTGASLDGGYWKDISGITYPYDLGSEEARNAEGDRATVMRRIDEYAEAKHKPTRLMRHNEVDSLKSSIGSILYGKWTDGTQPEQGYLKWWLSAAVRKNAVKSVNGENSSVSNTGFDIMNYGVRPILTVSMSDIS